MTTYAKYLTFLICLTSIEAVAQTQVSYIELQPASITHSLSLNGNIVAIEQTALASEVDARVVDVLFEAGDYVETNQPLIILDSSTQDFEVQKAEATLQRLIAEVELAELEKERILKLVNQRAVSQEELDQAKARLKQSKADVIAQRAQLGIEKDRLSKFTVSAPFSGVVSQRLTSPGALIQSNQALAQISQTNPLRVQIAVPQHHFEAIDTEIQKQDSSLILEITGPSRTSSRVKASLLPVKRLIGTVDQNRQFSVWGELENEKRYWLPGMAVETKLVWQSATAEGSFVIPDDAIVRRSDGSVLIWQVLEKTDESVAEAIEVIIDDRSQSGVSVRSIDGKTLSKGIKIVVLGNESLRSGQALNAKKITPGLVDG